MVLINMFDCIRILVHKNSVNEDKKHGDFCNPNLMPVFKLT